MKMTDFSMMDLEEVENRLYDLAVLMRRDGKSSFAAAELDEKFKLHYGSHVPVAKFGFSYLFELLDGSPWFSRAGDDSSRFVCVLRENYKFAYKIPKNPKQGNILINLEPEAWLLHIKKELEPDPPESPAPIVPESKANPVKQELPPPASPDPSPPPSPREISEITREAQMSPKSILDAQGSIMPQGTVSDPERPVVPPIPIPPPIGREEMAWTSAALHKIEEKKSPEKKKLAEDATAVYQSLVVPTSFPAPSPMRKLDKATEIHFKKLYDVQIAATPHLLGPVPHGLNLKSQVEKFVGTVGGILKTLGGRVRFDELEMEYRKQEGDSFAEDCVKYLSSDMGPFNVLRLISAGKIEAEILGPRMVYFCLKHPIDLLIDGVSEYLRLHGGKGGLGAVNTWFKKHYVKDLCTRCKELFGCGYLKTFREFAILAGKFVMELEKGRWLFDLTDEDLTPRRFPEASKELQRRNKSVVDVLINRILECLLRLDGRTSFGTLATLYEDIYKHPFDPLITHAFGPYQELASVANSKKKFILNLEGETWMFKLIEEVNLAPMDVEETSNVIGKKLSDAVPQPASATNPIPIMGNKLPFLAKLDRWNARRLVSTKSKPPLSPKRSVPPQKKASADVDRGPSRFGNPELPSPPRFVSSAHEESSTETSSSIAKLSLPAPNPHHHQSSSAHEESSTETIPALCDVDIGPRSFSDYPLSKLVANRLVSCLRRVHYYCIAAGEMATLYKNNYAKVLDVDLMAAFETIDLRWIKKHKDMRGKVDIWKCKEWGWTYRLERSLRPKSSRSYDRHRCDSSSHHRSSRSRSRHRSRSHEKLPRSKRSSSPRKSRRSRSRHRRRSSNDHHPRRGMTVTLSRSPSGHQSRSRKGRRRSRRRDSSAENSGTLRSYLKHPDRRRSNSPRDSPLFQKTKKEKKAVVLGSEVEVGSSKETKKKKE